MEIVVDPDSPIALAVRASILGVLRSQPKYALPLETAVEREVLAAFSGRTALEVDPSVIDEINGELGRGELPSAARDLRSLAQTAGQLERAERFIRFLDWYASEEMAEGGIRSAHLRKLFDIMAALADKSTSAGQWRNALDSLLWRPNEQSPALERAIERAWSVLGLTGAPPRKP